MQTPSAEGLQWKLDRQVASCDHSFSSPCLAAATLTAAACSCRSRPCAQCGQPGATKRCTKCGLAHYCSRDCQDTHWSAAHKFPCKQRGGRDGYLEALEVGFTKLRSWQSGLIGGRNQVSASRTAPPD